MSKHWNLADLQVFYLPAFDISEGLSNQSPISISPTEEQFKTRRGIGGTVVRTKNPHAAFNVTLRYLKSAEANNKLNIVFEGQKRTGLVVGFPMVINTVNSSDSLFLFDTSVQIIQAPTMEATLTVPVVTWRFRTGPGAIFNPGAIANLTTSGQGIFAQIQNALT